IARWTVARAVSALPAQPDLRPRVGALRDRDRDLATRAHFARPAAVSAWLARHVSAPKTLGTRPLHRESALPERDHPASATLGTRELLRARRAAGAVTHGALLVHF